MRYIRRRSKKKTPTIKYKVNEQITSQRLKVIDEAGEMLGEMELAKAIAIARERELSLVEVSPKANPPIAKIMDYGKFVYRQQKIESKQKANQKKTDIKGIKLTFRIGKHDLDFRKKQAMEFLEEGHKVKIELGLKGRERQYRQMAMGIIREFINSLKNEGSELVIEQPIKAQGGKFSTIVFFKKAKI